MVTRDLIIFVLILSLVTISPRFTNGTPDNKDPFTAKDMHLLNRISPAVTSPDNKYIVFSSRRWHEVEGKFTSNLYYSSLESPTPIQLTPENFEISDSSPMFSSSFPENMLFLRTMSGETQVYSLKFPPGSPREEPIITKVTSYPIDISNVIFTNEYIAFSADMYIECTTMECTSDKNAEVAKRGTNSYREYTKHMVRYWDTWLTEGVASHTFYQKIKLNENSALIPEGSPVDMLSWLAVNSPPLLDCGSEEWTISSNGKYISFSGLNRDREMSWNTKWEIYHYNIEESTLINLTESEPARCQNPKYSNDETKVSYLCMDRPWVEMDQLHWKIYDIASQTYLSPGNQDEFKPYIVDYIWYENDNKFILSVMDEGHSRLYLYKYNEIEYSNTYIKITDDKLGYGTPFLWDQNTFWINYSSYQTPEVIGVVKLKPDTMEYTTEALIDLNKDVLKNYELIDPESFNYPSRYGDTIQGWFFKPINFDENEKYPLAFLIHGGPEGAWQPSWSYRWNPQLWANHNYAVVLINPHGSSGFGIHFQDLVRNDWGGLCYDDWMRGWEYVKETYSFVDMEKVGACGGSFGGYMINWIQGHNDDKKFKSWVTHDGDFNSAAEFYASDTLWYSMVENCPLELKACTPFESEESRERFVKFAPETYANNWKTPHLIIHGGNDYRVPLNEGISAFTTLQIKGVPSRFLYFPKENHWALKPENSIKWYEEVLGWWDKYLEYN